VVVIRGPTPSRSEHSIILAPVNIRRIHISTPALFNNTVIIIKRKARVTDALCKGCGACAAACPSGAMEQKGFKSTQLLAMVDAALE